MSFLGKAVMKTMIQWMSAAVALSFACACGAQSATFPNKHDPAYSEPLELAIPANAVGLSE